MSEVMRACECVTGMTELNHCVTVNDRRNGMENSDAGREHSYVEDGHSHVGVTYAWKQWACLMLMLMFFVYEALKRF
jgi:hypothetical protein